MELLSARASNIDHGGADGEAVRAALALLDEANSPIVISKQAATTGIGVSGMGFMGVASLSGTSVRGSDTSTQSRVSLSGNEFQDIMAYIDAYKSLPYGGLDAYDKYLEILSQPSMSAWRDFLNWRMLVGDLKRNRDTWSAVMRNHLKTAVEGSLSVGESARQSLTSTGNDNVKERLDNLLNANINTEDEISKDVAFRSTRAKVFDQLNTLQTGVANRKISVNEAVTALVKFKNDTGDARKKLDQMPIVPGPLFIGVVFSVTVGPWNMSQDLSRVQSTYGSVMEAAVRAANTLLEFFLYQSGTHDRIGLFLRAIRAGAGMASQKNRRAFITDGSRGAQAKLVELLEDARALSRANDQPPRSPFWSKL